MTTREFYKAVRTSMRADVQENFINKVTDPDLQLASKMMMSKLNNFKPITTFTLEDLLDDPEVGLWLDTLVCGTVMYTINMQVSEWMHNGVDIQIDSLDIKDKMSEYQSVADRCKEEFMESLESIKSQMFISRPQVLVKHAVPSFRRSGFSNRTYTTYYKTFRYR